MEKKSWKEKIARERYTQDARVGSSCRTLQKQASTRPCSETKPPDETHRPGNSIRIDHFQSRFKPRDPSKDISSNPSFFKKPDPSGTEWPATYPELPGAFLINYSALPLSPLNVNCCRINRHYARGWKRSDAILIVRGNALKTARLQTIILFWIYLTCECTYYSTSNYLCDYTLNRTS